MKLETVSGPGRSTGKEWSWSYSKLKNFEVCPKRMYEVDIAKTYKEKEDPDGPLAWGNYVHKTLADVLLGKIPLPEDLAPYQHWVSRIQRGTGTLLVEQKYAITRQFQKTAYFASDVWYRGVGDVVRLDDQVALVADWKTGKILEDSVQLMLMAQCLFSHYPQLKFVRSSFIWLKDDCETPELLSRQEVADQWVGVLGRVNSLETAAKTFDYPPRAGRLCRSYCPVLSCPFHGKGARG